MIDLYQGLELNNVHQYTHLLTGYSRNPESLLEVANIVKKLKQENKDLIYGTISTNIYLCFSKFQYIIYIHFQCEYFIVCDPVMGDNGEMYVPEEILPVYKNTIVPLADIVTPNQYETELLTGIKVNNLNDALQAIQKLHGMGSKIVILSSTELGDENNMIGIASIMDGKCGF